MVKLVKKILYVEYLLCLFCLFGEGGEFCLKSNLNTFVFQVVETCDNKLNQTLSVVVFQVSEGTRSIHDKLTALQQQWSSNNIAEQIKKQKQAELEVVKNRWKNGVLQEQDERQKLDPKDMPDVISEVNISFSLKNK